MSADPTSTSGSNLPQESETLPLEDGPTGYGRLARRIARRTTDLLAIAIVAVGLLSVAGYLAEWWGTDPQEATQPASVESAGPTWGDAGIPVSLEFGGIPYTLRRRTVRGDQSQAAAMLLEECRRIVKTAGAPAGELDDAERRLLERLARHAPADQDGRAWKLYRFHLPLPLVLGTRDFQPASETGDDSRAERTARVVCWGMALPLDDDTWRLLAFHSPRSSTERGAGESTVPLPGGAEKILSLRETTGTIWVAFRGEGPPKAWIGFFDDRFATHGGRRERGWNSSGGSWNARYSVNDGGLRGRMDVQIGRIDSSHLNGLVSFTPYKAASTPGRHGPAPRQQDD